MASKLKLGDPKHDCMLLYVPPHHLICPICARTTIIENPEAFVCVICKLATEKPEQVDCCGKTYCWLCLDEDSGQNKMCLLCRQKKKRLNNKRHEKKKRLNNKRHEINLMISEFIMRSKRKDLADLKVNCDNTDSGCEWVGEESSLEPHLEVCDYAMLPCTNGCMIQNEIATILRKDLKNHLAYDCPKRQYKCPDCGETGEYVERISEHLKTCSFVRMECPNHPCGDMFPRLMLEFHRMSCEYEKQPCRYAERGCKEEVLHKDLTQHEEDCQFQHQTKIPAHSEHKQKIQHTFELTSFKEKKDTNYSFYSSPFYTRENGYRLCIRVDANGNGVGKGTHVSVLAYLMKGDNDDSLTWPFTGTVTVELLNQLEDKDHHTVSTTFPATGPISKRVTKGERGQGYGQLKFITHSNLHGKYLVDDTLLFRVYIDVPS